MLGAPKLGWFWGPILRRAPLLRNSSQGASPTFSFCTGTHGSRGRPCPELRGPHGRGEVGSTVVPPKLC